MSILDKFTPKKRGRPPIPPLVLKAPAIAERITLADDKLTDLRSQHGRAALDAVSGADGAQVRLDEIEAQIAAVERELVTLHAAHETAMADDEAALVKERAKNRANDMRRVEMLLKQSQDEFLAMQVAIANAVAPYRRAIVLRRKATLAAQSAGFQLTGNNLLADGEIERLVDLELFRQGDKIDRGDPLHFAPSFPRMHRHLLGEHPANMTPIHDRIVRQDAITLAALRGERPVDPMPVPRGANAPQPEPVRVKNFTHVADGIDAEAEREAIRAMMRKPAPPAAVDHPELEPVPAQGEGY